MKKLKLTQMTEGIYQFSQVPTKEFDRSQFKLHQFYFQIPSYGMKNEESLEQIIDLHRKLAELKIQRARNMESEVMRQLINMCSFLRIDDEQIPEEVETLEEKYEGNERLTLKLSSMLMNYAKEIINSEITKKEAKLKRYKDRVTQAIRLLSELNNLYDIKNVEKIFKSKIQDDHQEMQFFALNGLQHYYGSKYAENLTKEEEQLLEQIIETTDDEYTASTCCQILINDGKISEISAMSIMDDWKDKNRR